MRKSKVYVYAGMYSLEDEEKPWSGTVVGIGGKRYAFVMAFCRADAILSRDRDMLKALRQQIRSVFFDSSTRTDWWDGICDIDNLPTHPQAPFTYEVGTLDRQLLESYMEMQGEIKFHFFPAWAQEAMIKDMAEALGKEIYAVTYYRIGDREAVEQKDVE